MKKYKISSGNVFADLGFSKKEAADAKAKSALINKISKAISETGLKQIEAAALLGTDQPTLSKILRGRLQAVSLGKLTTWLTVLGYDVKIIIAQNPRLKASPGRLTVTTAAPT